MPCFDTLLVELRDSQKWMKSRVNRDLRKSSSESSSLKELDLVLKEINVDVFTLLKKDTFRRLAASKTSVQHVRKLLCMKNMHMYLEPAGHRNLSGYIGRTPRRQPELVQSLRTISEHSPDTGSRGDEIVF